MMKAENKETAIATAERPEATLTMYLAVMLKLPYDYKVTYLIAYLKLQVRLEQIDASILVIGFINLPNRCETFAAKVERVDLFIFKLIALCGNRLLRWWISPLNLFESKQ